MDDEMVIGQFGEIESASKVHIGRRSNNEDSVGSFREEHESLVPRLGALYVLADGMGGHNKGEVASRLAVQTIATRYYSTAAAGTDPETALQDALTQANEEIHARAEANPDHAGMGTTAVAALVLLDESECIVAHAGDSRAYLVRDGEISQLTKDHSWVQEQVDGGTLTPEEARAHKRRAQLTRALGRRPKVTVDVSRVALLEGDVIVLCSDGLSGPVPDALIAKAVYRYPPEEAALILVNAALRNGGRDNVSVIVIRLPGGEYPAGGTLLSARRTALPVIVGGVILALLIAAAGLLGAGVVRLPGAMPTAVVQAIPEPTPSVTATATPTPWKEATETSIARQNETSVAATLTARPTETPVPTWTFTASPTPSPTDMPTETPTLTPTNTPTATPGPTHTLTSTPTATASPTTTPAAMPSATASPTRVPTRTPSHPLAQMAATLAASPTGTPTKTPAPTMTATGTPTTIPTDTLLPTPTQTEMRIPTATVDRTRVPVLSSATTTLTPDGRQWNGAFVSSDNETQSGSTSEHSTATGQQSGELRTMAPVAAVVETIVFRGQVDAEQDRTPTSTVGATATRTPTLTPTETATPTVTFTPTATVTPTALVLYPAPVLKNPGPGYQSKDGKVEFRWSWSRDLGPDESFEVVMSGYEAGPFNGAAEATRNNSLTIYLDAATHLRSGPNGAYYWTVRVQRELPPEEPIIVSETPEPWSFTIGDSGEGRSTG